ncbi:MAG TPA: pantoate--beta-alanine ligase [Ktedonobacterales bacterium]|nr:pantoate--beta-alanine ligase [Ktedonobacterales bacterium]
MRLLTTLDELRDARVEWRRAGAAIGLLPTMGYLHEGHLSHARAARAENDIVVASVFVNPAQFGPNEDLARYPRDLPRDTALLEGAGVDAIFAPTAEAMYPDGFNTWVEPSGPLTEQLEAAHRPGHFRGVATVVTKLFTLVAPTRAYFGQKDAQQVAVVRRLIADLNLPVELRVGPIIREPDGLAMSSRNVYLTGANRAAATALSRALSAGRTAWESAGLGAGAVDEARAAMRAVIAAEPLATLDYAEVCDPDTCLPLVTIQAPALLAIAARIGATRLIDNYLLRADGSWEVGRRIEAIPPA